MPRAEALVSSDLLRPVVSLLPQGQVEPQTSRNLAAIETLPVTSTTPEPTLVQPTAQTQQRSVSEAPSVMSGTAQDVTSVTTTTDSQVVAVAPSAETVRPAEQASYASTTQTPVSSDPYRGDSIRSGFAKLTPDQVSAGGLSALGSVVLGTVMLALSKIRDDQSIASLITGNF